jgi:hypothetical protein
MKRTVTIPKEEFLFFEATIKDEVMLDDYSFNEVIEK